MMGARDEAQAQLRHRFERFANRLDLVTREEFEAVRQLAANARAAQEVLEARVAALEARLAPPPERVPEITEKVLRRRPRRPAGGVE